MGLSPSRMGIYVGAAYIRTSIVVSTWLTGFMYLLSEPDLTCGVAVLSSTLLASYIFHT